MATQKNEPSRMARAASGSDVPLEDRYALLIEAVQDYAIFMLDADGKVWFTTASSIAAHAASLPQGMVP